MPNIDAACARLEASGLQLDSRQVVPGDVFFALAAEPLRSTHITQALQKGARWIVVDDALPLPSLAADRLLPLPSPKANLAQWAADFYQHPSRAMTLVGITGTNGKSTTAFLLAQLLEAVTNQKGGVIGTLGFGHWCATLTDTGKTTPDAINLQRILRRLVDEGITQVAMEVSSHALDQGRVAGVHFAGAVFTNLSRDHLDYHGDMDSYAEAKGRLFRWPGLPFTVLNADDPYSAKMQQGIAATTGLYSYSSCSEGPSTRPAAVLAENCSYTTAGISFNLRSPWGAQQLSAPLLGHFNVENLLASLTTVLALHPEAWSLLPTLTASLQPVTGRMHLISSPHAAPKVVVDYAHTPDALEKALAAVRVHATGKLWVVFGCGGDRDKGKRVLMAQAAEAGADRVVITSDNPRSEDPHAILADITQGLAHVPWLVESDRRAAIAAAIA
ncbi:MAG TPA: UDP-N-acetylmuramoyl-L-alanyl-D-glutamate--2,6-diaminopimelate ligase, partial [Cellvibrionaceae bacterium]|nr:UDP-N-acetylmuramoyl-L-alanyl-D-glutamate--2,6-diaminopimelate ligase [Cellvibrionaceae bacterium]